MLKEGMQAPNFTLMDQNGKAVSLSDFRGRRVILYFYSKDNTSGCTAQACSFAARYPAITEKGAVVIGISKDGVASHQKFAAKYALPFLLLSDPELVAIRAYDVWQEKRMSGQVKMGVVRSTFLIDEEGKLLRVMSAVKASTNAEEVLALL